MPLYRVLVIGGYGFFGRRLVERLARNPGLHLIVAGRSATQGLALVGALRGTARAQLDRLADPLCRQRSVVPPGRQEPLPAVRALGRLHPPAA